jgi:hypothetical protein
VSAAVADVCSAGADVEQSDAASAVAAVASALPDASLEEVLAAAELQTRTDRKYLVQLPAFARLGAELADTFHVLQIEGRRTFAYESVYFDTPDLVLYRQHLQGRRRRYKVRTRSYLDSGQTMLEAKLKGLRGETVKTRWPHPAAQRRTLTHEARTALDELLGREYGLELPDLVPSVTTTYWRTTLVDLVGGSRVTCDVDLVCSAGTSRTTPDGRVLVETKTAGAGGLADQCLHKLGVRPVSVSKYCVGVALLHPDVPANPWHRLLRRHFGYDAA